MCHDINDEDIKEILSNIKYSNLKMYADRVEQNSYIQAYLNVMTSQMSKIAKLLYNTNMDNEYDIQNAVNDYLLWKKSIIAIDKIICKRLDNSKNH